MNLVHEQWVKIFFLDMLINPSLDYQNTTIVIAEVHYCYAFLASKYMPQAWSNLDPHRPIRVPRVTEYHVFAFVFLKFQTMPEPIFKSKNSKFLRKFEI